MVTDVHKVGHCTGSCGITVDHTPDFTVANYREVIALDSTIDCMLILVFITLSPLTQCD